MILHLHDAGMEMALIVLIVAVGLLSIGRGADSLIDELARRRRYLR